MQTRRAEAFAWVLIATGAGLLAWFGQQWMELPQWSEAEIAQSVEVNLALDLQRLGPHLQPQGEKLEQLRALVRTEVEGEIRHDREQVERWLGLGLICLVFGASQRLLQRGLQKS